MSVVLRLGGERLRVRMGCGDDARLGLRRGEADLLELLELGDLDRPGDLALGDFGDFELGALGEATRFAFGVSRADTTRLGESRGDFFGESRGDFFGVTLRGVLAGLFDVFALVVFLAAAFFFAAFNSSSRRLTMSR